MRRGLVCFPPKRIKFYGPEAEGHSNPLGQSIIYLGDRRESFCEEFADIGAVMGWVIYASD
jgi:hypothetical protein